ncbi:MAG: hypothetical protein ACLTUR_00310 [Paraclostridium sordellii]
MNYVEPIRNLDTLENMCSYLKKTNTLKRKENRETKIHRDKPNNEKSN